MAAKRVDPAKKVYAVCGSVQLAVKEAVVFEAQQNAISVASMVGVILTAWAEGSRDINGLITAIVNRRRTESEEKVKTC